MSAGYFDTHPSSVERALAARRQADELLAQGDPPGRREVLALEHADERAVDSVRGHERRERSFTAAREPAADTRGGASRGGESEGCQRAAVFAEMARYGRGRG